MNCSARYKYTIVRILTYVYGVNNDTVVCIGDILSSGICPVIAKNTYKGQ